MKNIDTDKLEKLMKLENEPEVKKWLEFKEMPQLQKNAIVKEWAEYREKVKQTRSYRLFHEMRQAVKEKNSIKVKQLKDEAVEIALENNFLPVPKFPDPDLLRANSKVKKYLELCIVCENLRDFKN